MVNAQSADGLVTLESEWLLLETGTSASWTFEIEHPGDYNAQVLFTGAVPANCTLRLRCGETRFMTGLRQDLVIDNPDAAGSPLSVTHIGQRLMLSPAGLYDAELEVENASGDAAACRIVAVRVVPRHCNKWASPGNQRRWREMHASAPKQQALREFNDMKFGMFIHWGLYSQVGGVWKGKKAAEYPARAAKVAEWIMRKAEIPRAEYRELAKTFNPAPGTAEGFVTLAKAAGMRYIALTSKHHDGFALYGTTASDFNIVDATPYARDFLDELYAACRKHGIGFALYYSHGVDWMDGGTCRYYEVKERNDRLGIPTNVAPNNLYDPSDNTYTEYIRNKALPQVRELMQRYPEMRFLWYDGENNITEAEAFDFYQTCYDINPAVLMSRRIGYGLADFLDAGDNGIPRSADQMTKPWQTIGTTNNSWGYASYDHDWKTTLELLYWLVDVASKGGSYMLNIGPRGDGSVPEQCVEYLEALGNWLAVNGEAIYATTGWTTSHEGDYGAAMEGTGAREKTGFSDGFGDGDFWFTCREHTLYAIALKYPAGKGLITSLARGKMEISAVSLLGSAEPVAWEQTDLGLEFALPGEGPDPNGYVLKID